MDAISCHLVSCHLVVRGRKRERPTRAAALACTRLAAGRRVAAVVNGEQLLAGRGQLPPVAPLQERVRRQDGAVGAWVRPQSTTRSSPSRVSADRFLAHPSKRIALPSMSWHRRRIWPHVVFCRSMATLPTTIKCLWFACPGRRIPARSARRVTARLGPRMARAPPRPAERHVDPARGIDKVVGAGARPHAGHEHDLALGALERIDRGHLHRGARGAQALGQLLLNALDLALVCMRQLARAACSRPGVSSVTACPRMKSSLRTERDDAEHPRRHARGEEALDGARHQVGLAVVVVAADAVGLLFRAQRRQQQKTSAAGL